MNDRVDVSATQAHDGGSAAGRDQRDLASSRDRADSWRRGAFIDVVLASFARACLGLPQPLDAAAALLQCADRHAKSYLGEVAVFARLSASRTASDRH